MGKPAFDIRDSPSLKLAQRIACSGFSLAVLGGEYVESSSCWKKLEPRLAALRPRNSRPAAALSAKVFRDGWRLRYRLQPATVAAMVSYGRGPSFLPRLSRLEQVCASDLERHEYIPTLLTAALALEWTRSESKLSIAAAKRRRALQVLDRILARWKPARNRRIELPSFEFAGLLDHKAAHLAKKRIASQDAQGQLRDVEHNLAHHVLRPSAGIAATYPGTDPYRAVDYLLRIGLDEVPLTDPPLLRWGLDLAACLLATEALFICDADHPDFSTFHRKRADALLGLAQSFFGEGKDFDLPRSARAAELVSQLEPSAPESRRLAFGTAFTTAQLQFQLTMRSLGVDLTWFRELWDLAHSHAPARAFARLGRSPRYMRSAARRAANEWQDIYEEIEKAVGNASKAPTGHDQSMDEWAAQNPELFRALNGVEADCRPALDTLRTSLCELGTLAEKYRPGCSMGASEYQNLVRIRALHEDRLRQCSSGLPKSVREHLAAAVDALSGSHTNGRRPAYWSRTRQSPSWRVKTR
jgi:hypothetical protein